MVNKEEKKGWTPVILPAKKMPPAQTSGTPFREAFLLPVKLYRKYLSPAFPPVCRYTPTCSAYCMEAVRKWGILRGCALSLRRILRCNPFGGAGYDPVPEKDEKDEQPGGMRPRKQKKGPAKAPGTENQRK